LGWATITHPFHPYRGQCLEVLKTRRVAGIDTLILCHPELGSCSVSQEWTDWQLIDSASLGNTSRKLAAESLLQLASLLAQMDEATQETLDE
jgi:hypothetical protein